MEANKKFYYSKLNGAERKLCDYLIYKIRMVESSFIVPFPVSPQSYQNVFNTIQMDFPEYYYLSVTGCMVYYNNPFSKISLKYYYNKSTIMKYNGYLNTINNEFLNPTILNRNKDFIVKYIHDGLMRSVVYIDKHYISEPENYSIIGPLLYHSGVCQGYASAFLYFCNMAGIDCMSILGQSRLTNHSEMGDHAWNMVRIHNQRLHIDVTWNSCIYHSDSKDYYRYFKADDEKMSIDHT